MRNNKPTLTTKMNTVEGEVASTAEKLDRILSAVVGFKQWRPSIDASVQKPNLSVTYLTSCIMVLEAASKSSALPPAPQREGEVRASGHRVDNQIQGHTSGTFNVHGKPLGNGELLHASMPGFTTMSKFEHGSSSHTVFPKSERDVDEVHAISHHSHHAKEFRMPKVDFPKFDGEHPKIWKEKCEKYFAMYNVPPRIWAQFATLHFIGTAALWLQTFEAQHTIDCWAELCVAVDGKFEKDLYANHMRYFLSLKQVGSVIEYYEKFEGAMHHVLVHNRNYDDVFFVSRFTKGLKYDVRAAILLHKPRTVDVAFSLALMQEELLEKSNRRPYHRQEKEHTKISFSKPPLLAGKGILGTNPINNTEADIKHKQQWNADKYSALRSARRTKGMCMKCGEK